MKQNVFKSIIFRIAAIIIILVLPINIMTLVLSNIAIEKNQEQMFREIQTTLEMNADNFEDTLARASKKLTYFSFSEPSFITLANLTEADGVNERGALLNNVKQSLNLLRLDYPWIDLFYYQFPKADYILCTGYPGIAYQECRGFIKQASENEAPQELKWQIYEIDGMNTLFSFQSWNDANFGAMINLERLLDKLRLPKAEDGRSVFFTNTAGSIYTSGAKTYATKGRLMLEELKSAKKYDVFTVPIEQSDLVLVEVLDWNKQAKNLPSAMGLLQVFSILMFLAAIPLLILYIRKWVVLPLNCLTKAIDRIERGDLDYRIEEVNEGLEFNQINRNFNDMMEQVKNLKIDIYAKEIEKNNIKMRYLSQQIQPHFILNAMNIIYSYEPEEYPLIQKMVLCISKYFRYIVKMNAEFVTLEQEMEHIKNYFEIQEARFPGWFTSVVKYDDSVRHALIPPLLLQSFAENAIKHSLKIGNNIAIFVNAEYCEEKSELHIRLSDTGVGMSDEVLREIEAFQATGVLQENLGVGIQNAIERLKYLYSKKTSIRFWRGETSFGTNVEIALPAHYMGEQKED